MELLLPPPGTAAAVVVVNIFQFGIIANYHAKTT